MEDPYLRVIYYDDDQYTCSVSEIICDDMRATKRTCELQNAGRHVRISTTDAHPDRDDVPSIESLLKTSRDGDLELSIAALK